MSVYRISSESGQYLSSDLTQNPKLWPCGQRKSQGLSSDTSSGQQYMFVQKFHNNWSNSQDQNGRLSSQHFYPVKPLGAAAKMLIYRSLFA